MRTPRFISVEKAQSVLEQLDGAERALFNEIVPPGVSEGDGNSAVEVLEHLFRKIPSGLLDGHGPHQLLVIVRTLLAGLQEHIDHPQTIFLREVNIGSFPAIGVVVVDSPFIVSSIAECLSHSLGLQLVLFMHPMVIFRGQRFAFSFVEMELSAKNLLESAVPVLRSTLATLRDIIADHRPMSAAVDHLAQTVKHSSRSLDSDDGEIDPQEVASLLRWFTDERFFFVGTTSIETDDAFTKGGSFGIWNTSHPALEEIREEVVQDVEYLRREGRSYSLRKLRQKSPVHRRSSLLHLLIKADDQRIHSLVGFLTSKASAAEAEEIPILRQRVNNIIRGERILPQSYDYKYVTDLIDNMPTDEALCSTTGQLRDIVRLTFGLFDGQSIRALAYLDSIHRRAVALLVLPSIRFSAELRDRLRNTLEDLFQSEPRSSGVHLDSSKRSQNRLYLTVPVSKGAEIPDLSDVATTMIASCRSWEEILKTELACAGIVAPVALPIFPESYQVSHTPREAVDDLRQISRLSQQHPVSIGFRIAPGSERTSIVSIHSRKLHLSISRAVPIMENLGLEVLHAFSYFIPLENDPPEGRSGTFLLELKVRNRESWGNDTLEFSPSLGEGLAGVITGEAASDQLNSLMRSANLRIDEVRLLRAYCQFLWQVTGFATRGAILEALASNAECASLFIAVFSTMFDPDRKMSSADRKERSDQQALEFTERLRSVKDITQDRVLRALLSILVNTLRSNYYSGTDCLALKFASNRIDCIPEPRPRYEIFVTSPRIEGVHLRTSDVARGGIRWSERPEDFRSEVLGLVKTQRVKNVIIVPSGAKGGFIVRRLPREPEKIPAAVSEGYQEYIRALLSITDNVIDGTVVHPPNSIVHDTPDPYFVVAADKGTATFSDIANTIAINEFRFWLGDAFASGGSKGYDHKKYGITARGGWECVRRHFHDLGIRYEDAPITVAGIGDMSGDVFGNGLLLSEHFRLIGAFNHKHVFVDPNPDPAVSFHERQRLFRLARSQWSDYSAERISAGGGVFGRYEKDIRLSPQLRSALAVPETTPSTVDGEQLISLILRAPVDLLWSGGIGTYVKAAEESHTAVTDGTNDRVRIDATEVRARVIGEGGNMGLTQRGRIEFSSLGGSVNTDAIDNSGGVDLSDHEVNLKLLLNPLKAAGRISEDDRVELLRAVDAEVVDAVLNHNREQALMLSLARVRSKSTVEQYQSFIREMNRLGFLNRSLDSLPDDEQLGERSQSKIGLWRPELAVCAAAAKMWIREQLSCSTLLDDPLLESFLVGYFPRLIRERHLEAIKTHPLRREIIAAEVVNMILPVVGITYVHSMAGIHSTKPAMVTQAALAADLIVGGAELRVALHPLDRSTGVPSEIPTFIDLWLEMSKSIRDAASWLLSSHGSGYALSHLVALYREDFNTLVNSAEDLFVGDESRRFAARRDRFRAAGLPDGTARRLAALRRALPIFEVLWSARKFDHDVKIVSRVFATVLDHLDLNSVFRYEALMDPTNKWEQEVIISSFQEIRRGISLISGSLLARGISDPAAIAPALERANGTATLKATTQEIRELSLQKKPLQVAALSVIARQLHMLAA